MIYKRAILNFLSKEETDVAVTAVARDRIRSVADEEGRISPSQLEYIMGSKQLAEKFLRKMRES